jgi:hypothetical protein
MKNVYDNGRIILGEVILVKEYICKNADDITEVADIIEDLENLDADAIVAVNYDHPMGYTIEYWSNDNIVDEDKINDEDDEPMDNTKPWEKY